MALDLHSGKYVNLKPGRVGGLTPAVAIHDACHDGCVPCYVGAVPQSGIGARHALALAAKENFLYPADYIPPEELLEQDLAPLPEPVRGGQDGNRQIPLWSEPGIGVEPDVRPLEEHALGRASL
jgi:O-succinylbenzoate synthase